MTERIDVTDLNHANLSSISPNDLYLKSTFLENISASVEDRSPDLNLYDCFKSNSFKMSSFIDDFLESDRHISGHWTFSSGSLPPEQNVRLANSNFINNILLSGDNRRDCITLNGNGYYSRSQTLFPPETSASWVNALSIPQYAIPNLDYVHRLACWIYEDLTNRIRNLSSDKYEPSYVGQIIHTTRMSSQGMLQQKYGPNTSWKQHIGYSLRGATSGVKTYASSGNNAFTKDDGDNGVRTIPVIEHQHSVSHGHDVSNSGGGASATYTGQLVTSISISTDKSTVSRTHMVRWWPNYNSGASSSGDNKSSGWGTVSVLNTGSTSPTVDINQAYKNVYIWERIS